VHPQWLFECRSRRLKCAEETWIWTWNADKTLEVNRSAPTSPTVEPANKKRIREESTPPQPVHHRTEPIQMAQISKLLDTVSSPQKTVKRKLTGRARNTQVSTVTSSVTSPDEGIAGDAEDQVPKPTQEKVEYKDPIAEREMAKIVASLQGLVDGEKLASQQRSGMTPAEDSWRMGGRRKSSRK
jgi:hypothetical protein